MSPLIRSKEDAIQRATQQGVELLQKFPPMAGACDEQVAAGLLAVGYAAGYSDGVGDAAEHLRPSVRRHAEEERQ